MLGSNTNEGTLFVYQSVNFIDNLEYDAALLAIFGSQASQVHKVRPV
jgi:hypothetical protein